MHAHCFRICVLFKTSVFGLRSIIMILMLFHDKLSHSEREVSQLKIQCKRFHLLLIGPSAGFIEEEKNWFMADLPVSWLCDPVRIFSWIFWSLTKHDWIWQNPNHDIKTPSCDLLHCSMEDEINQNGVLSLLLWTWTDPLSCLDLL